MLKCNKISHNLLIVLTIIFLDQLSKFLVIEKLLWHGGINLINTKLGGINLFLTYNTGAAFGFLHNSSGWQNYLFLFIAIIVAIVIIYLLINNKINNVIEKIAMLLILGGSVGNLMDRIIHGHVIDFIDVYIKNFHWYTFNVADSAICIAMGLLIINNLLPSRLQELCNSKQAT